MKILLADDHKLLLEGLNNLLTVHGMNVVGMAHDGLEAVKLAQTLRPDVILMDIRMPNCDGLEATRQIMADMPSSKIVILTTSSEEEDLFTAVKSGAYGYLLKSMDADELVEALGQVSEGIPPFSPGLASRLLREFTRLSELENLNAVSHELPDNTKSTGMVLTAREKEVLSLVSQGFSYKQVGECLNLSSRTVKYHMSEIVGRLHLENRAQVLAYAGRIGLGGVIESEHEKTEARP